MAFDGTRALIVGDYVTVDGQLGPWANLVSAIGIEPRSTLMKSVFAIYGVVWLLIVAAFAVNMPWAKTAMLAASAGALWFLPVGTLFSLLQIGLLLFWQRY